MNKIKISADGVLSIVKGIFADEDIDLYIKEEKDPNSGPSLMAGMLIQEILNVEYYTFKHRPLSTEDVIAQKIADGSATNVLESLDRSFCLLSLNNVERLFSKDVDMTTLSASLEYWIQTSKIKILEELIDTCNIALCGKRINVDFDGEQRKVVIIFGKPEVTDIQPNTACGEMAVCEVSLNMIIYPDAVSYADYLVSFRIKNGNSIVSQSLPVSGLSFANSMTQKSLPCAENTAKVGSINTTCFNSFVLTFDGYNGGVVDYFADRLLSPLTDDNNTFLQLVITRKDESYIHNVAIKDHQITVNADTGNETHTLTLVTSGV